MKNQFQTSNLILAQIFGKRSEIRRSDPLSNFLHWFEQYLYRNYSNIKDTIFNKSIYSPFQISSESIKDLDLSNRLSINYQLPWNSWIVSSWFFFDRICGQKISG